MTIKDIATESPITCGENVSGGGAIFGCGKPIEKPSDVYRCTDCSVAFHRDCAMAHFNRDRVAMRRLADNLHDTAMALRVGVPVDSILQESVSKAADMLRKMGS